LTITSSPSSQGYPSVGSICGVSNAAVASALRSPVLLVGKAGVGDAVDSFNLNATYLAAGKARVLGAVFNKFPREGFYNLLDCQRALRAYFAQYRTECRLYGCLPDVQIDATASSSPSSPLFESKFEEEFTTMFCEHFDLSALLIDLWSFKVTFIHSFIYSFIHSFYAISE